jgi:predicted TIM-barrel fold metal-dependent hydrolase
MISSRRRFLATVCGAAACGAAAALPGCSSPPAPEPENAGGATMQLDDFEPKSTLVVPQNPVLRAKYPAIDVHTHVFFSTGLRKVQDPQAQPGYAPPEQLSQILEWMDQLQVQTMVNLTGGTAGELTLAVDTLEKAHPGRFLVCTEPSYERFQEPDFAQWQADELGRAQQQGARGLKILKTLGLSLREQLTEGPLVPVDDPRFDPLWEAAGGLGFPVFIHTSDPDAFFTPIDRFNERWEELGHHPDWSFYGKDFPSKQDLLAHRNRVIARHPKTTFVGLHVANHPENLAEVGEWLERYPNLNVETGARLGELGRQPRAARSFFEKYQDRILFGTDAVPLPDGDNYPQQVLKPEMFQGYFRFFETNDEYFDYSPAAAPPQGRWKIYGIALPDEILKKVYHNNAARLFGLELV